MLKQADFSACADDLSTAPTCVKWNAILQKMKAEKTPFSVKELAVSGKDILNLNVPPRHVSKILQSLLLHTACQPHDNTKKRLSVLAIGIEKELLKSETTLPGTR